MIALLQWGDKHLAGTGGPSLVLEHTPCGHDADPLLVCRACRKPIELHEIQPKPGPGASQWIRERLPQLTLQDDQH